ncbi:MAG TPA: hypothetical protein PKE04_12375, partial [Clostridia bacterium]|nr:hypothetical protein [Clostridia bacterium]
DLIERMEMACEAYVQYGVYPIGLTAPKSYLFSREGLDVLRGARVVALFDTDEAVRPQRSNLSYADGHSIIAPAGGEGNRLTTDAYSTAVYLDVNEDIESLRNRVAALTGASKPVRSLWQLSSSMYLGERYVFASTPDGDLLLNGEQVNLAYQPFDYEANFDYQRGFMQFLTEQMETSNKLILLLVAVSVTMFFGMILTARRSMRRQFLIRPEEQGEERGIAP